MSNMGHNFVPSSDIESVRPGRPRLRTYEAKSDFATLTYNSRLREVITFLSSYLHCINTQTLGFIGHFSDFGPESEQIGAKSDG